MASNSGEPIQVTVPSKHHSTCKELPNQHVQVMAPRKFQASLGFLCQTEERPKTFREMAGELSVETDIMR